MSASDAEAGNLLKTQSDLFAWGVSMLIPGVDIAADVSFYWDVIIPHLLAWGVSIVIPVFDAKADFLFCWDGTRFNLCKFNTVYFWLNMSD